MTVEMTFGAWLKRRRRQLDLTQKELARRVSCAQGTIRKIESDTRRPSIQLAQLIATHLDIPPQQQPTFVTFARSQAYSDDMVTALAAMEEASQQPLAPKIWPEKPLALEPVMMRHNLPAQSTSFVGRTSELTTLNNLLAQPDNRLITVVGPGGIGKTRLVLAYAEQVLVRTDLVAPVHGVFFVNLAPLSEAEQIVSALAEGLSFQLRGGDGRSPRQQLLDYLRSKKMLLLFDNFEHLLDGVDLLTDILQAAPEVQILVTSRERLHLQAEVRRQFDEAGLPLCAAGLSMPLKFTYNDRTTAIIPYRRAKHVCPLFHPEPTGEPCPIDHKKWPKGGCSTHLAATSGSRIRHQLDRESDQYKTVYAQRTAVERIFSQAKALGMERPKLRNQKSIANQNSLIYLLINLRMMQRVLAKLAETEKI